MRRMFLRLRAQGELALTQVKNQAQITARIMWIKYLYFMNYLRYPWTQVPDESQWGWTDPGKIPADLSWRS